MEKRPRVLIGDQIRLYGFPGLFVVTQVHGTRAPYDFAVKPIGRDNGGWAACDASVVEINGMATACLSAPLTPPAADYPHRPMFLYDDGPQELGKDAIAKWAGNRT